MDWWAGVDWWIGGLVEWKLSASGSEVCKSSLARATAMARRITVSIIIVMIMLIRMLMLSWG